MRTVLKNLVDGLSEAWIAVGQYWKERLQVINYRSFWQRIGCRVMSRLFHLSRRPCATVQTRISFLGGLRLMALDGTVFDRRGRGASGAEELQGKELPISSAIGFKPLFLNMEKKKYLCQDCLQRGTKNPCSKLLFLNMGFPLCQSAPEAPLPPIDETRFTNKCKGVWIRKQHAQARLLLSPKFVDFLLIEAGTHLIVDALMCPYRIGERKQAKKLLRSHASAECVLMWDRGLHSYKMVQATLKQKCDYLGRIPKNVKFSVEKVLPDGSYLSWIAPDGKSQKKGGTKIGVRVIEYTIDTDAQEQIYRLITSLTDIERFPALLLATEYHRRWEVESTIDELKIHLLGRKTLIRSLNPREVASGSLWLAAWTLGCAFTHVSSCRICSHLPFTIKFYWLTRYRPSSCSQISAAPN